MLYSVTNSSESAPHRTIRLVPVVSSGTRWLALFGDRSDVPIRNGYEEENILNGGWRAVSLLSSDRSTSFLLQLTHSAGPSANWLLDEDLRLASIEPKDCINWFSEQLQDSSLPDLVSEIHNLVLLGIPPAGTLLTLFAELQPATRACWINAARRHHRPQAIPEPISYSRLLADPTKSVQRTRSGRAIEIDPIMVQKSLGFTFLDHVCQLTADGVLRFPSVIDGAPLTCDLAIYVNSAHTLYRFCQEERDFVFFAFAGEGKRRILALYFPGTQAIICDDLPTAFSALSPGGARWFEEVVFREVIQHASELLAGRATSPHKVVFAYGIAHIGHHLWNDLSGVNSLVSALDELPEITVFNSQASERFGQLQTLFPELKDRIRRLPTESDLGKICYQAGEIFVTPSGEYVSAELRHRIMRQAYSKLSKDEMQRIQFRSTCGKPIILVGLRVEDRTVVNQVELYAAILNRVADRAGGAIAIVDGINVPDHGGADDHVQRVAGRERRLFKELAAVTDRRVELIDSIGATMGLSLAEAASSSFFVAPWGAGLVKYRWATNIPGLAIASASFLTTAHDRDIYHSPETMETPTPMYFPPLDALEDVPVLATDPQRVNVGQPSLRNSMNVVVDPRGIIPLIDDLIDNYYDKGQVIARVSEDVRMQDALIDLQPYLRNVRKKDNTYEAERDSGEWIAIRKDGSTADIFNSGWSPLFIFTGFAPVYILELAHIDGERASWYLDADMGLLALRFESLRYEFQLPVRAWAARLACYLIESLLFARDDLLDVEAKAFLQINPFTREDVFSALEAHKLLPCGEAVRLSMEDSFWHTEINYLGKAISIDHANLRALLQSSFMSTAAEAILSGAWCWPSPADGSTLLCDGGFALTEDLFIYRFIDSAHDLTFFAVACLKNDRLAGIWFPKTGNCVTTDPAALANLVIWQNGVPFQTELLKLIARHGHNILSYATATAKRMAICCHLDQIGLPDLCTIYDTMRAVAPDRQAELIALNIGAQEPTKLPLLLSGMITHVDDLSALNRHAFNRSLIVLPTKGDVIRRKFAERTLSSGDAESASYFDRNLLRTIKALSYPIVLIGLPMDWQPTATLEVFCRQTIERLLGRCNGLAVIIDCSTTYAVLNSAAGSATDKVTPVTPLQKGNWTAVLQSMRERFASREVLLIDTLDAASDGTSFWANHCDFFVAFPGQAVARLTANKPGLVVAVRSGLFGEAGSTVHTLFGPPSLMVKLHIFDAVSTAGMPGATPMAPREYRTVEATTFASQLDDLLAAALTARAQGNSDLR